MKGKELEAFDTSPFLAMLGLELLKMSTISSGPSFVKACIKEPI